MQTQLAVLSLVSAPQNTVTCWHLYRYYCPRPVDAVSCCKWECLFIETIIEIIPGIIIRIKPQFSMTEVDWTLWSRIMPHLKPAPEHSHKNRTPTPIFVDHTANHCHANTRKVQSRVRKCTPETM